MKYDVEKNTYLVNKYIELKSFVLVKRLWRTKYKNLPAPSDRNILMAYQRFQKTGSVNRKSRKPEQQTQKRKDAQIAIENLVSEFPKLSLKIISGATQTSVTLARSVLKEDLKRKPYKIPEFQELKPADYEKRVNFASWFLKMPANMFENIIMSDEAYFYLTESANKQNNRSWLTERPSEGIERPLQDKKVLVFCAISAVKIYGPFFVETSVNQHSYLNMLKNWFWPKHLRTEDYKKYYFQQDGATAHTANIVQTWLKSKFGQKFLTKEKWPPRSCDLNPCDFFLWGHLKNKVYNPLPLTIDDLKTNIEREIKKIEVTTLKSTFLNLKKRLNLVISAEGGHIEVK